MTVVNDFIEKKKQKRKNLSIFHEYIKFMWVKVLTSNYSEKGLKINNSMFIQILKNHVIKVNYTNFSLHKISPV